MSVPAVAEAVTPTVTEVVKPTVDQVVKPTVDQVVKPTAAEVAPPAVTNTIPAAAKTVTAPVAEAAPKVPAKPAPAPAPDDTEPVAAGSTGGPAEPPAGDATGTLAAPLKSAVSTLPVDPGSATQKAADAIDSRPLDAATDVVSKALAPANGAPGSAGTVVETVNRAVEGLTAPGAKPNVSELTKPVTETAASVIEPATDLTGSLGDTTAPLVELAPGEARTPCPRRRAR